MGLSDDPRYHDACMPESSAQVSENMRETIDALRAEVAALTAELERWNGPLTDGQLGSICAIIDEDQTPEMDTKINSLDTVIRVVRAAGENP